MTVRLPAGLEPRRYLRTATHQPLLADQSPHRSRTGLSTKQRGVCAVKTFEGRQPTLVYIN